MICKKCKKGDHVKVRTFDIVSTIAELQDAQHNFNSKIVAAIIDLRSKVADMNETIEELKRDQQHQRRISK